MKPPKEIISGSRILYFVDKYGMVIERTVWAGDNPIVGGQGDDIDLADIKPKELEIGLEVEQEHIKNAPISQKEKDKVSKDIQKDHYEESPQSFKGNPGKGYYERLEEMEEEMKDEAKELGLK